MTESRELVFFHAPRSRSAGVRILLEELQAPHRLQLVDMKAGAQRQSDYLAINPMGKLPALKHGDALITEQVAIYIYLADEFSAAGLAPAIGHPLRGPYLRWMAFYGSCFEPALVDRAMQREPGAQGMSPYGDFDTVLKTLTDQLEKGPYLLGETFSALDVLWASALGWTTGFKIVPLLPVFEAYIQRMQARPAFIAAQAKDAALISG